jgi:coatomer protein complex subunit alpha (xenin)
VAGFNQFNVITMDITMIHKLEGHERGVNWAIFHPSLNLIASSSDDKRILIWKYSFSSWSEADCLRGHNNNVSCVIFHPKLDYILSNSEDKTLRIWDLNKKSTVEKMTKENDRFWILASHPTISLFAAGTDSELIVFKLEDTRIPSISCLNNILFYFNNTVKLWKEGITEKKSLCKVSYRSKGIKHGIVSIIRNPFIKDLNSNFDFILLVNDSDKKKVIHYSAKAGQDPSNTSEIILDEGTSACYLAKNRLLVLNKEGDLYSYDVNNFNQKVQILTGNIDKEQFGSIFQATLGRFFLKFKNGIVALFDVNTRKILKETTEITEMKYVVWNSNMTYAALVGQTNIFIINKNMEIITKIKEKSSIKSACFDENDVLFYTTYFHVKYALIEPGLYGIIKSTETPLYLMNVRNSMIYYSNANQSIESEKISYVDVNFKLNLLNKNYENIVKTLKSGSVYGNKAVESIQNAGFPDLSMKFVVDMKQKFNLALKSGKLDEAKEAAEKLKDKIYFDKLAEKAMIMGKLDIAEFCYVKSENLDKLIFFYTITGRQDKLKKVTLALKQTGDNSRRFLNAIYTCNNEEKINVLKETGHTTLALLVAKLNERKDIVNQINESSKKNGSNIKINENDFNEIKNNMGLLTPLKPVVNIKNKEFHSNWSSVIEVKKANQQASIDNILNQNEGEQDEDVFSQIVNAQDENDKNEEKKEEGKSEKNKIGEKWEDNDEDEDDEEIKKMLEEAKKKEIANNANLTQKDDDIISRQNKSLIPGIQVALGNFKLAFNYLRSQLGIRENYESLRPIIKDIYLSSYSQFKIMPYLPPIEFNLRQQNSKNIGKLLPQNGVTMLKLKNMLNKGYACISNFEMAEAIKAFRDILKYVIFFVATNEEEETEIKNIINICTEYIYLAKISLLADDMKEKDKVKYCELICLMSLCKLELDEHKFLIYKKAKYCCKNIKNFITALFFIKKMAPFEASLGSTFKKEFTKIKEEIDLFQKIGTNKHQINFDTNENLPCIREFYSAYELKRVGVSEKILKCPLCNSVELNSAKGKICDTCHLSTLGEEVIGFKVLEK